jgi:ribonuclease-3
LTTGSAAKKSARGSAASDKRRRASTTARTRRVDPDPGQLERIAGLFGLTRDAPHLRQALTHPSYANERRDVADNQRLEFLGDAVLGFCTSDVVYERHPAADEGTLTRLRAQLVNAETLAAWAKANDLALALRLGRGAGAAGLQESTNVLADAVEALIAATYLDAGLEAARKVCNQIIEFQLNVSTARLGDPKSELQESVQAIGAEPPRYELVESGGPPHERWFRVQVLVGDRCLGIGEGRSKRLAERAAAEKALKDWLPVGDREKSVESSPPDAGRPRRKRSQ